MRHAMPSRSVCLPVLIALMVALMLPSAQAASWLVFCESVERDKTDVDILVQRLSSDGTVGWGDDAAAKPFASGEDIETGPVACTDGQGGAIVVYQYEFTTGDNKGDVDLVAQRADANGTPVWNEGERPMPVGSSGKVESHPLVLSDGQGGAFVVYEWRDGEGDCDVVAQRISGDGKLLWNEGEKPVGIGASATSEQNAVVVPDGQGGIIVVYEWHSKDGNTDIMAQRVSGDGEMLWNSGEYGVDLAGSTSLERLPSAVPDGQGGAIAVFEFEYTEGEHKGDIDIMAQRVSGEGLAVWYEPQEVASAEGKEGNPIAISDGAGGVIAAFEYVPIKGEHAGDKDMVAQRLGGDGKMMWNEGKKSAAVSTATHLERSVRGIATADGGAIFVFESETREGEHAGDIELYAQRLSPQGAMMWNNGERSAAVADSNWLERDAVVLSDEAGGLVVVMTMIGPKGDEFEGDQDVDAVRLSDQGLLLWKEGKAPVDVAAQAALERNPCAVLSAP